MNRRKVDQKKISLRLSETDTLTLSLRHLVERSRIKIRVEEDELILGPEVYRKEETVANPGCYVRGDLR